MTHIDRIIRALEKYRGINHEPSVEDPQNDFERAVNAWSDLDALHTEIKNLIKPLATEERAMRDGLADSLRAFFADALKEGVNNHLMSNGRKLKLTHKVKREIDAAMIPVARGAFQAAGGTPEAFEAMLRVKYELDLKAFRKAEDDADKVKALAHMITSKNEAPVLEVD